MIIKKTSKIKMKKKKKIDENDRKVCKTIKPEIQIIFLKIFNLV